MAETVAAIAAVAAAIFAAVALAVALRAKEIAETANGIANDGNVLAEGANGLAQDANATAEAALTEAAKANQFANEANQLSDEANAIAERALRVAQDEVPYNWGLKIDDDGTAAVINDCAHLARMASVTVDSGGQPIAQAGPADVAPFAKITLDVTSALDGHFEEVRKNTVVYAHEEGGMFFGGRSGRPVAITFRAHLSWQTEQLLPRNDVVQETLHHQMTPDGLKRSEGSRRSKPTIG